MNYRIFKTIGVACLIVVGSFAGGWVTQEATRPSTVDSNGRPPLPSPSPRHVEAKSGTIETVVVLDGFVVSDDKPSQHDDASITKSQTIEAEISPEQLARFTSLPETGRGRAESGPATQDCRVSDLLTSGGVPIRIRCTFSHEIAYPGVQAQLALTIDRVEGVVTLPLTAVDGSTAKGVVYVAGDGAPERRRVALGINDGVKVEIKSGVTVGEEVLDPPPSIFSEGGPH
jgi:hypothetical protein